MTDVAKCRDGMAASGLPPRKPYSGVQPDCQNSSPYSTIIRRSSGVPPSSIRPRWAAYHGGAVGTDQ